MRSGERTVLPQLAGTNDISWAQSEVKVLDIVNLGANFEPRYRSRRIRSEHASLCFGNDIYPRLSRLRATFEYVWEI